MKKKDKLSIEEIEKISNARKKAWETRRFKQLVKQKELSDRAEKSWKTRRANSALLAFKKK